MSGLLAEMLDGSRIRCGTVELRHRTPIFALARRLLADGADPAALLTVRWASTGTVSMVEPIGKLARLDVVEDAGGKRGFRQWQPKPASAWGADDATGQSGAEPVSSYPAAAEAAQRCTATMREPSCGGSLQDAAAGRCLRAASPRPGGVLHPHPGRPVPHSPYSPHRQVMIPCDY